jgi:hypothetical protein
MDQRELLLRVHRYISHAHIVYSNTHKERQNNLRYEKIIDRIAFCKNAVNGINRFSGKMAICRLVLVLRKPLKDILPNEANKSFANSLQEYNEIIAFCEVVIKIKSDKHEKIYL